MLMGLEGAHFNDFLHVHVSLLGILVLGLPQSGETAGKQAVSLLD